jgi:hypothetical protein
MKLDLDGFPRFEPLLLKVCHSAFTRGLESLRAMGLAADSHAAVRQALTSVQAQRRFIRGVHTGYDQAQSMIGCHVVEWERQVRDLERLRATKPRSAHAELDAQISLLCDRQLVLRRVLDAILFSITGHELQVLRRMTLDNKTRRIDPDVVETTLGEARRLNRESRYRFNLVCDLTTIVQVGDLVQIDKALGGRTTWRIVELKSGRVNRELKQYLDPGKGTLDDSALKEIERKMGQRAVSQAKRMERQIFRIDQVERMARTDRAIDARTGKEVRTNVRRLYPNQYGPILGKLIEKGATELAVRTIDRCLHFVCLPKARLDEIGGPSGVRHIFFHLMHPDASCAFEGAGDYEAELQQMKKIAPLFDFVELNLRDGFMQPLFMFPLDFPVLARLVSGQIRLFTVMDFEELIRMGCEAGIPMRWATPKETEGVQRFAPVIPGSPDSRGIQIVFPGYNAHTMLAGSLFRVYSDLTTPTGLLMMAKYWPEQRREIEAAEAEE